MSRILLATILFTAALFLTCQATDDLGRFGWIAEDLKACSIRIFFEEPGKKDPIPVEDVIAAAIDGANHRIYIAMYSFTSKAKEIVQAIKEKADKKPGLEMKILLDDSSEIPISCEELATLPADIQIRVVKRGGPSNNYFHHKLLIIDDALVITGSYDLTRSAHECNWENIALIWCSEIAEQYSSEFYKWWDSEWAKEFCRQ